MDFLLWPFYFLFLQLDGIIYSLLSYSFSIFRIISQTNLTSLFNGVLPVIDRIEAIILVLVFVKLGITLVQFLMNPDKLTGQEGGAKIIVRIFVVAAFLILYKPIFGILNEVSMLVLGYDSVPGIFANDQGIEEPVKFEYLGRLGVGGGSDEGLLTRLIFGRNSEFLSGNFGGVIAGQTLSLFLYDTSQKNSLLSIFSKSAAQRIAEGQRTGSFSLLYLLTPDIGRSVAYQYPIISHLVGAYLCWVVIKIAIELATRMFKLIVLEFLAPIAIIAYLDPKTQTKVTDSYLKSLGTIYADAFIRVGALYIMMAFIGMFFANKDNLLQANGVLGYLALAMVVVAAVKFVEKIPELIKRVFNVDISGGGSTSFSKFLNGAKSMVGGAVGFGAGAISGARAAKIAGSGKAGGFFNSLKTAIGGAQAGSKGKGIADTFNQISANNAKGRSRAEEMAIAGGFGAYTKSKFDSAFGRNAERDMRVRKIERERDNDINKRKESLQQRETKLNSYKQELSDATNQRNSSLNSYNQAKIDAIKNKTVATNEETDLYYKSGLKDVVYGDDKETFVDTVMNLDEDYMHSLARIEKAKEAGVSDGEMSNLLSIANTKRNEAHERAEGLWEDGVNNASGQGVDEAKANYDRSVDRVSAITSVYEKEKNEIAADKIALEKANDSYNNRIKQIRG